ncbi:thymidylate synthase [Pacmanvirus S19]|nr:thymidylate synthase [Pacmanvirus S19]
MQFDFIVATDSNWGIARCGQLPWKGTAAGREDMIWFKNKTTEGKQAVIMGRKTWESIPAKFRPLPNRINIILSSKYKTTDVGENSQIVTSDSFESALKWCLVKFTAGELTNVMVIGGAEVYKQAIYSPYLRYGYVTIFNENYDCDLQFPVDLSLVRCEVINITQNASYIKYDFGNTHEQKYLNLLSKLLVAPTRDNRTGIPTQGFMGKMLRFPLIDCRGDVMPLMTTKRVPFKTVAHELIWFLQGSTDISYLAKHGVKIWDGNSSTEYLKSVGLTEEPYNYTKGQLGPIYGFQWRKFNNPYGQNTEESSGIDQIAEVIKSIKQNPYSRRHIVCAWNPEQLHKMALPPCHVLFQFYVEPDLDDVPTWLSCMMYQRSGDQFLGEPFNISSYSLLTHIIAKICNLKAKEFVVSICDVHLYSNHIKQAEEQITRQPLRFPTLKFSENILQKENLEIDDFAFNFTPDDFIISDYKPYPAIKAPMAV